jgi:D-lactate dehydrogenase
VQNALLAQYEYDGIETCAADGSCKRACPVAIDTGELVKDLRRRQHSARSERVALEVARRYGTAERAARGGLRAGGLVAQALGDRAAAALPELLRDRIGDEVVPAWSPSTPRAASGRLPRTERAGARAVYLPACINRIFGGSRSEPPGLTVPEALVAVSQRAGLPLWIPDDVAGRCCGTPWSSKGYGAGLELMAAETSAALQRWSENGRLPVVIDATSCTHGAIENLELNGIEVLDSVAWVHDHLLERLQVRRRLGSMLVHPTCASAQIGVADKLTGIAGRLAEEVIVPAATRCCGMAGDRGWLHPELPATALDGVVDELDGARFDACVSSNRTCELALREVTRRPYKSIVLTLEELTR